MPAAHATNPYSRHAELRGIQGASDKGILAGHPCGDAQVGGLRDRFHGDYDRFFTDYDRFRYQNERHLPACIEALDVAGKKVLEIGLGEGAESERLIAQGAHWSGVDLTA